MDRVGGFLISLFDLHKAAKCSWPWAAAYICLSAKKQLCSAGMPSIPDLLPCKCNIYQIFASSGDEEQSCPESGRAWLLGRELRVQRHPQTSRELGRWAQICQKQAFFLAAGNLGKNNRPYVVGVPSKLIGQSAFAFTILFYPHVSRWSMLSCPHFIDGGDAAQGFPDSSVGKESACNEGDPSSIPGSGRPAGERIG